MIRWIVAFLLVGCLRTPPLLATEPSLSVFSGNVMTLDYRILVGGPLAEAEKQKITEIMQKTFAEIDTVFNKWNVDSEVSKLNRLPRGMSVKLSPEMHTFLCMTADIVALTEGLFDPTIAPVQDLWRRHLEQSTVPTPEQIALAAKSVGWEKIHFDEGFFYKDVEGITLDFGGIAKGYAVDLLLERLNAANFEHVLVDWSGEMRSSGHHPEGRPWSIAIQAPEETEEASSIVQLNLAHMAIATSGDYLQNWTVVGESESVTYFHIIHPGHHRPLIATQDSIASATVMTTNCALADALATALMMFPTADEAREWSEKLNKKVSPLQTWVLSRKEWQSREQQKNKRADPTIRTIHSIRPLL